MGFEEHELTFREADRRYAELKRRLDAGEFGDEEFDAHDRRLMDKDDIGGRWWTKSRSCTRAPPRAPRSSQAKR